MLVVLESKDFASWLNDGGPALLKPAAKLEQLTRLPKFDHPAFDIFRCIGCGVVSWIAQEDE